MRGDVDTGGEWRIEIAGARFFFAQWEFCSADKAKEWRCVCVEEGRDGCDAGKISGVGKGAGGVEGNFADGRTWQLERDEMSSMLNGKLLGRNKGKLKRDCHGEI